jgi:flagellar basal-body rod modification protein FlgD
MSTNASAVSSSASLPQQSGAVAQKNVLGKDDFLKLLIAQLSNQDPLQPVDNQAFIGQLAQFSSLEQLQGVSSRLDTLLQTIGSSNQTSTASMVGRSVTYDTDGVDLVAGTPPSLQANLEAAGSVTAVIQDSSGRAVRTIETGAHAAGSFDLGWDGRDGNDNALPSGRYTVTLSATASDGSAVTVGAQSRGVVKGVSLAGGATQLMVGSSLVNMSDVVQITQS